MVDISVNTNGSISLSANNSSNINANTNGEAQRAKSWAVGTGLIDGVDYSSKYYALLAKQSEEITTEAVETIGTSAEAAQGYAEDAASSAEYIVNHAPTITVEQTETGATITATDMQGTTTADVINGINGQDGQDGFSPIATVTKSGNVATITITDKNGTTTANVYDGSGGGGSYIPGNGININNNTISVDTSVVATQTWVGQQGYLTAITSSDVTTALGYTPANQSLSNLDLAGQYLFDVKMDTDYSNADYEPANQSLSNLDSEGQDKFDVKIDLDYSNANYIPVNRDLANLSSTGQAKFDAKVNKSGDTMTGILQIRRESGNDFLQIYPNVSLTTPPASNRNIAMLVTYDVNNNVMAKAQQVLYSDGGNTMKFSAFRPNNSGEVAVFEVGWDANGNKYCTFPNTTCCDGQWVQSQLIAGTSVAKGNYNIDLSSYLPNDGYMYEVMINLRVYSSNSSNAGAVSVFSDVFGKTTFSTITTSGQGAAGGNSRQIGNTFILPVGSQRLIVYGIENYAVTNLDLILWGYRRVGTNA